MTVHTKDDRLKLLDMIFEARYEKGYRFLDHSGELIVRIKEQNPTWVLRALGQQVVSFVELADRLILNISTTKIDVSISGHVQLAEAEGFAKKLGEASEKLYHCTVEVLKLGLATRVSWRFRFLAPSDSLEESDRFVLKAASSSVLDGVVQITKGHPSEANLGFVIDDPETGHRKKINIDSMILEQKPDDPPFQGLPGDPGSGGVVVDIDTYFRPNDSQVANISLNVQSGFYQARSQAQGVFQLLLKKQK